MLFVRGAGHVGQLRQTAHGTTQNVSEELGFGAGRIGPDLAQLHAFIEHSFQNPVKNQLAIGVAPPLMKELFGNVPFQEGPHFVEGMNGAVVGERPGIVGERMRVRDGRLAHGGTTYVCDDGSGVETLRRCGEMHVLVGRRIPPLETGNPVGVAGDSPTVRVLPSLSILLALFQKCVLCIGQGTLDLGGLVRVEPIETAHRLGRGSWTALVVQFGPSNTASTKLEQPVEELFLASLL